MHRSTTGRGVTGVPVGISEFTQKVYTLVSAPTIVLEAHEIVSQRDPLSKFQTQYSPSRRFRQLDIPPAALSRLSYLSGNRSHHGRRGRGTHNRPLQAQSKASGILARYACVAARSPPPHRAWAIQFRPSLPGRAIWHSVRRPSSTEALSDLRLSSHLSRELCVRSHIWTGQSRT